MASASRAAPDVPAPATLLSRAGWVVRRAGTEADRARAYALRGTAFSRDPDTPDRDPFDAVSEQILVERDGTLVATCRLRAHATMAAAQAGYSGQFYDLSPLAPLGPALELGRFCLAPGAPGPDALRLAWAGVSVRVERAGAVLLFGCPSFPGTDPARHDAAFACLAAQHIAPDAERVGRKARDTVPLAGPPAGPSADPPADPAAGRAQVPDPRRGQRALPPLLRSYLALGGTVSDHAVVDRAMDTLHVFTAVRIDRVPPGRARALSALAAD